MKYGQNESVVQVSSSLFNLWTMEWAIRLNIKGTSFTNYNIKTIALLFQKLHFLPTNMD